MSWPLSTIRTPTLPRGDSRGGTPLAGLFRLFPTFGPGRASQRGLKSGCNWTLALLCHCCGSGSLPECNQGPASYLGRWETVNPQRAFPMAQDSYSWYPALRQDRSRTKIIPSFQRNPKTGRKGLTWQLGCYSLGVITRGKYVQGTFKAIFLFHTLVID